MDIGRLHIIKRGRGTGPTGSNQPGPSGPHPPLHLLAALLAQEQGLATRFIQEIGGVDHRQLNRELDKLLGKIPPVYQVIRGRCR